MTSTQLVMVSHSNNKNKCDRIRQYIFLLPKNGICSCFMKSFTHTIGCLKIGTRIRISACSPTFIHPHLFGSMLQMTSLTLGQERTQLGHTIQSLFMLLFLLFIFRGRVFAKNRRPQFRTIVIRVSWMVIARMACSIFALSQFIFFIIMRWTPVLLPVSGVRCCCLLRRLPGASIHLAFCIFLYALPVFFFQKLFGTGSSNTRTQQLWHNSLPVDGHSYVHYEVFWAICSPYTNAC